MHPKTLAIHGGSSGNVNKKDVVEPVHRSTIYRLSYRDDDELIYTRADNPNRQTLERLLVQLECSGRQGQDKCEGVAFSSGMAATSSVFQSLSPGDHILAPDDVYHGTRTYITQHMSHWGLEYSFVDMTDFEQIRQNTRDNTRLIWVETPSNPLLKITDISRVAEWARQNNILLAVDNTWATPVNLKPLDLGADLVVHSTTKYLGGHSDILGGCIIARRDTDIAPNIRSIQQMAGAVPSPDDCWMMRRSIGTLPYRMQAHNEHAAALADWLQQDSRIEAVYYPGLSGHPGHAIAKEQMNDFGGMISFQYHGDAVDGKRIVTSSSLIAPATSLGGIESTWEHRRSSEHDDSTTPDDLIRISVGLEHIDDLTSDIDSALSVLD